MFENQIIKNKAKFCLHDNQIFEKNATYTIIST